MNRYWRYAGGSIAAFLVVGILLPSRAVVERDIDINAYAPSVFALLNDFSQVSRWSGRFANDPNARISITGPPRGVGARVAWSGHIVGSGEQTIIASEPYESIVVAHGDRDRPTALTRYALLENEGETRLSWSYEKDFGFNLPARFYGILLRGIAGDEVDADLQRIKAFAERLPRSDFSELAVERMQVKAGRIAYRRASSIPAASAISAAMGDAYFEVMRFIDRYGLEEAGAPISIMRTFSGTELVFDAGIPVRGVRADTPVEGRIVKLGETYGGPAIRVKHTGPYRTLGKTHEKIAAWLAALGIERNGDAWEVYISDPTQTVESELLTYVYYPVREKGVEQ